MKYTYHFGVSMYLYLYCPRLGAKFWIGGFLSQISVAKEERGYFQTQNRLFGQTHSVTKSLILPRALLFEWLIHFAIILQKVILFCFAPRNCCNAPQCILKLRSCYSATQELLTNENCYCNSEIVEKWELFATNIFFCKTELFCNSKRF